MSVIRREECAEYREVGHANLSHRPRRPRARLSPFASTNRKQGTGCRDLVQMSKDHLRDPRTWSGPHLNPAPVLWHIAEPATAVPCGVGVVPQLAGTETDTPCHLKFLCPIVGIPRHDGGANAVRYTLYLTLVGAVYEFAY
jgi:hypothetical protein